MLPISDILHRTVVYSLVGICIWGVGTGIHVHRETLRQGRGEHPILAEREAAGLPTTVVKDSEQKEEADEQMWAQAAQRVFQRTDRPS